MTTISPDQIIHASDCASHNAPAYVPVPCDCGAEIAAKELEDIVTAPSPTSPGAPPFTNAAHELLKELQVVHSQAVMTKAPGGVWEQATLRKIQQALDDYHADLHREWMNS